MSAFFSCMVVSRSRVSCPCRFSLSQRSPSGLTHTGIIMDLSLPPSCLGRKDTFIQFEVPSSCCSSLLPCRHVRWVCRTCWSLFVLAIACYVFMHRLFWKRSSFFPCRTSWTLCTCQCDDALQNGHQPWPPFVSYTLPWIELEDLLLLTTVVAKKLAFKFLVCSMGLSLPSVFYLFSLLPNLGMLSMSWIASYKSMRATLNHRSLVFNFFSQITVSHVSFHLKKHNFLSNLQCTRISILLIIAHTSPC